MRERLGHRRALDGVRAVAILGVMGLHTTGALAPGGFFGVDIFFVLSAFLISTLVLEELDDRSGSFSFRSFYARRALRLGPALILWLIVVAPPTAFAQHEQSKIGTSSVASIFYFANFAMVWLPHWIANGYQQVWSLAIEEQFYAIWPAVLVIAYRSRRHPGLGTMIIAALATLIVADFSTRMNSSYFLPEGHLLPLAAGALAALLFRRRQAAVERLVRSPGLAGAAIVFFVAVLSATGIP